MKNTKNSLRNMIFMPSEGVFLPGLSFFMDVFQTVKKRFCPILCSFLSYVKVNVIRWYGVGPYSAIAARCFFVG